MLVGIALQIYEIYRFDQTHLFLKLKKDKTTTITNSTSHTSFKKYKWSITF